MFEYNETLRNVIEQERKLTSIKPLQPIERRF
jgi:hypothetical protein